MVVVDVLIPEKRSLFSNISLSRRTVTRRIEELAEDLKISLRTLACKFELYTLAVDESTDQTDIAQLAVYIRGITPEFYIIEELANLVPLTGTTTGTGIFEAVNTVLAGLNLTTEKLQCIASDGAPSMTGKRRGDLTLLENSMKDDGHNHELLKVHCIIHQEALCAKHVTMKEEKQTVKTVNFIRSRALNHRQFQQLLQEMDSEYGD